MNPNRSELLRRKLGFLSFSAPFGLALLTAGCMGHFWRTEQRPTALDDAEARRAGALALYSKGLLLESTPPEGGNSNAVKEAALQAFRQALVLEPDSRRSLSALVSNLTDRNRFGEAQAALESYLQRRPDDAELRFEAARCADAAGHSADAARHCALLLQAHPDSRELTQALVRLHFQCGQADAALAVMRNMFERFHDDESAAQPVRWAVHFSGEEKRPSLALACLTLAIGQRTNAVERAALIAYSADCQLALGHTNAAFATLHRAYDENPASMTPLFRLGALWALRQDATNTLARLASRGPRQEAHQLILAAVHQTLKNDDAAIATLRAYYARRLCASRFPEEGFYLWYGGLLDLAKRPEQSERLFLEALAVHPGSHEIKNYLAYTWAEKGIRLEEANRLSNDALKAEPENAAYLDTKGWILFKSGRVFDALQFLLHAAKLDSEEPVILDHTGDALAAAGRENEAIAFWTRSYSQDAQAAVADKLRGRGALPQTQPAP